MPRDPKWPDRPDHPDFWRLSKVALAHDAIVDSVPDYKGKTDALRASLAEIADPKSVDYMALNRVGLGLQKMGLSLPPELRIVMMATWVDAFRLGFAYAQELAKERDDGKA